MGMFTNAQKEDIIRRRGSGESYRQIADAYGCTPKRIESLVYYYLHPPKKKEKKPPMYAKRKSCMGCKYLGARGGCNFLLVKGYSRGCKADNCTQYTAGKKARGLDPFMNRYYKEDFQELIYSQETV